MRATATVYCIRYCDEPIEGYNYQAIDVETEKRLELRTENLKILNGVFFFKKNTEI